MTHINPEQETHQTSSEQTSSIPPEFLDRLEAFMHDKQLLFRMAEALDQAYKRWAKGEAEKAGQKPDAWLDEPLFSAGEKQMVLRRYPTPVPQPLLQRSLEGSTELSPLERARLSVAYKERKLFQQAREKYSMSIAPFVALQEAVLILCSTGKTPEEILSSIANDTVTPGERAFLSRFAHATWYKDQSWRGREFRTVVKPFDKLTNEEREIDWHLIVEAATVLLTELFPKSR